MRPVTRYEAIDGTIYLTEDAALKQDGLVILAQTLEREFGYIDFDPYAVARFIVNKYDIYEKATPKT